MRYLYGQSLEKTMNILKGIIDSVEPVKEDVEKYPIVEDEVLELSAPKEESMKFKKQSEYDFEEICKHCRYTEFGEYDPPEVTPNIPCDDNGCRLAYDNMIEGTEIKMVGGPYEGFKGEVIGTEGKYLKVSMTMFGRETDVTVDYEHVEVTDGKN